MPDPLSINGLQSMQPIQPASPGQSGPAGKADGKSFEQTLMESLNEVNKLQQEAAEGTEKLLRGETDNIAEVFSTVRKADVAFSMLMEMRNKLTDAYREIQQMRV